ncbi:MAG TPA: hypothetical protein VI197_18875 [Polyangiaceae bacterium]
MTLTHGSRGFAVRAKQLIVSKTPFVILVGDPAAKELRGRILDRRLVEPTRMTANRHLRVLIAVVMLAATSGGTYEISEGGSGLVVRVFWTDQQAFDA